MPWKRGRFGTRSPLTVIELIIAIATLVGGVYLLTPFLDLTSIITSTSNIAKVVADPLAVLILGLVVVVNSSFNIYGIWARSYKIRTRTVFIQILIRLYSLIAGWLISGFGNFLWLTPLVVLLVLCVIYLHLRQFQVRGIEYD